MLTQTCIFDVEGKDYEVTVSVDVRKLGHLVTRAVKNKSKVAKDANGGIVVSARELKEGNNARNPNRSVVITHSGAQHVHSNLVPSQALQTVGRIYFRPASYLSL